MTATRYRPAPLRWLRIARVLPAAVENVGFAADFGWQVLRSVPLTLRRYHAECIRLITDMTWGRGSIIVGGGTVPMLMVLGGVMGAGTGIEAFSMLDLLGMGPLTGIISSFANTRELAPIAAGIGFAAQAGCRMTAEIGAMRISEEIDALESLGLQSIPFVVTTRVIAGAVAIVPTFLAALILAYLSCAAVVIAVHGQSSGVYYHYFFQFVSGRDIIAAVLKVLVFTTAVILIHCYQGFYAAGGPEGVGIASGRAVRASFVTIIALDMALTLALWGVHSSIRFTG
ncbi:ABC transporter permease [Nocardia terpenica]|uniref:ABC transporter permease n=1 Tax=Nocardia terpenica TaxID=455432 RepID=UPI0018943C50|nr:ABC transporter permease [Nocardia terpenica]MBF6061965.1 ABC transporter permease [Nocardia terpenica]MBF6106235.1 ABC transporter permease [Nocardia terpenica]MBF6110385.1 ABC transporter permease [Nocardia terpenica]MBF6120778.1 ABC transporter permease [Nocardia terpenica]MBF6151721.1 ABC transporter permease [Nocardia terpenica]